MQYILNESFTSGFNYNTITVLSLLSILCGILVITSKNPIVSVLFLIGLFLSIASYLMLLGINFIGLSYLLVYVGAVSILFLFILMLINVRVSELTNENSNSIPLAIFIVLFFNITLTDLIPNLDSNALNYSITDNSTVSTSLVNYFGTTFNNNIFYVSSQTWDGVLAETNHITAIGNVIYTSYPMWLILTSLILLLAMVGAIIITIKQKTV